MKSSWDVTKETSKYHFDAMREDRFEDVIQQLGHLPVTWQDDLPAIIENSKPANWETRGYKGQGNDIPSKDLAAEEYDLERVGIDPKVIITGVNGVQAVLLHLTGQTLRTAQLTQDTIQELHSR